MIRIATIAALALLAISALLQNCAINNLQKQITQQRLQTAVLLDIVMHQQKTEKKHILL